MKKMSLLLLSMLLLVGCGSGSAKEEATPTPSSTPSPTPTAVADTTGPWIDVKTYDFETTVGKQLDLSGPTAIDDVDGSCNVTVEGTVDWNTAGTYYVKYVAMDTSGNKSEVPITVVVKAKATTSTSTNTNTNSNSNNSNTNNNSSSNSTATATPAAPATNTSTSGCATYGVKDPNLPCDAIIDWEVAQYEQVWQNNGDNSGSIGSACNSTGMAKQAACDNAGGCQDDKGYFVGFTCEDISTNDYSYWGVGLKYNYNPN